MDYTKKAEELLEEILSYHHNHGDKVALIAEALQTAADEIRAELQAVELQRDYANACVYEARMEIEELLKTTA